MNDLICPLCHMQYNLVERMPRLFWNCGHTFCTTCIKKEMEDLGKNKERYICPIDRKSFAASGEPSLSVFPPNLTLQSILRKKESLTFSNRMNNIKRLQENIKLEDKKTLNFCFDHQKNCELICLKDQETICTDCVLFGRHNSHKIWKFSDFKKKLGDNLNDFEDKTRIMDLDIKSLMPVENINDMFETKQVFLNEKLERIFRKLRNEVDNKEKETEIMLDERIEKFSETIDFIVSKSTKVKLFYKEINSQIVNLKNHLMQPKPNNKIFLENLFIENGLFKIQDDLISEITNFNKVSKKLVDDNIEKIVLKKDLRRFSNNLEKQFQFKKRIKRQKKPMKPVATQQRETTRFKSNNLVLAEKTGSKSFIHSKSFVITSELDHVSTRQRRKTDKNNVKISTKYVKDDDLIDSSTSKKSNDSEQFLNFGNMMNEMSPLKIKRSFAGTNLYRINEVKILKNLNKDPKKQFRNRSFIHYEHTQHQDETKTFEKNFFSKREIGNTQEKQGLNQKKIINLNPLKVKKKSKEKLAFLKPKNSDLDLPTNKMGSRKLESRARMDWSRKEINDTGLMKYMSNLDKLKKVKILDLSHNSITNFGFEKILQKAAMLEDLCKLDISGNCLTEEVLLKILKYSSSFKRLRYFNLKGNNNIHFKKNDYKKLLDSLIEKGFSIEI